MMGKEISFLDIENKKTITKGRVKGLPIGYCTNRIHTGYLLICHMEKHQCVEKECPYFRPNLDHPEWALREARKLRSEVGRILRKAYLKGQISRTLYEEIGRKLNHSFSKKKLLKICHRLQDRRVDIPEELYFQLVDDFEPNT